MKPNPNSLASGVWHLASGPDMVTLFVCGDVMTGRGIDQILPHPSPPNLYEPAVSSALEYVALAEHEHGPIPRTVDDAYVWGDALEELQRRKPAARIINLETSITASDQPAPKGINYRMHPANIGVLTAAGVDCATLANNHVLDWGDVGLYETLDALKQAGIRTTGAGRTLEEAESPAIIDVDGGRVLVLAVGGDDSGVPRSWSADPTMPGVNWIGEYSARAVDRVAHVVGAAKRDRDIVIVSLHWGANWGYDIPDEHREFAHQLIDRAHVDLIVGHSSHHVKAIEVYNDRAILYGCGDFLNDYEGITGTPEGYRDDLTFMYFPTIDLATGQLSSLELVPMLIRNFRLQRPSTADARWLRDTLDRECRSFGTSVVEHAGLLTIG